MSSKGSILSIIRGGQITIHYIRMAKQVVSLYVSISLIAFLWVFCFLFFSKTTNIDRGYAFDYFVSYNSLKYGGFDFSLPVHSKNGYIKINNSDIVRSSFIKSKYNNVKVVFVSSVLPSSLTLILTAFLVFYYIRGRGIKQMSKELVRGGEIVDKSKLIKIIKDHIKWHKKETPEHLISEGVVNIGGVNIPSSFEVTNFLVVGDQGVKKSQLLFENIKAFRDSGRKCVIYDPSGDSIRHFYDPEKDIILNPLDSRSSSWSIWAECKKEYQLHSIAEAMIEGNSRNQKDFFVLASRIVFVALVKKTTNITDLMRAIKSLSLDDLVIYLKGTDAAIIIDENGMRAAQSVRAVLLSNVATLEYTKYMKGKSFSINDWVTDDREDGFLFITCPPNQLRMLKPLITIWIDIVLFSILSLEPSAKRRIGTFLDEFVSLNKLESFADFLAQARKYGNVSFVGIQNISQLIKIYGDHGAKEITGLCGNWVVFRSSEEGNAKWISNNLYSEDVIEKNESTSFGSNSIRDGVNINENRNTRHLVTPTEIQSLPDGFAFLRVGRGFPIAKIEQEHLGLKNINIGFIEIDDDNLVFNGSKDKSDNVNKGNPDAKTDNEQESNPDTKTENKKRAEYGNIDFTDIDIDY